MTKKGARRASNTGACRAGARLSSPQCPPAAEWVRLASQVVQILGRCSTRPTSGPTARWLRDLWGGQGPQLLAQLHWAFVSARLWLLCARHRSLVACLCGQQPVMGALSAVCLPRSTPRSMCLRLQAVPLGPRPMPPFALRHVHARARGVAAKCRWGPSSIVRDIPTFLF